MTCPNSTSWCGFAQRIVTCAGKLLNGKSPLVIPIPSKDYPSLAKRPNNSVLSNAKLEDHFAPQLPRWEIALDAVIQTLS
jgi:dTDP-4-dehydrorhamnose reductase